MSKHFKKPRLSSLRTLPFTLRRFASLSLTLLAIASGTTASAAVKEGRDSRIQFETSSDSSLKMSAESFDAFVDSKQSLQLQAEQAQIESEDAQLHWEQEQKRWEEIYRIYANDYAVSIMQMEVAEQEGWVEDVKRREAEAESAWAIAADARQQAEDAFMNAQANLVKAQSSLTSAQTHLKQKRAVTVARYEQEEADAAESLEKCLRMKPMLRPFLASSSCALEEEIHGEASLRTFAAKQSSQHSEEGDMKSAHEWETTANAHTRELMRLSTEQLQYKAKLIGIGCLSIAVIAAVALFVIATQQQKARRLGEKNSSQLAMKSQALLDFVLAEELYLHMLEILDEMLEREDATPFILNLRLTVKIMSLLVAQARIAVDDWCNPDEQASVSSTSVQQIDSDADS